MSNTWALGMSAPCWCDEPARAECILRILGQLFVDAAMSSTRTLSHGGSFCPTRPPLSMERLRLSLVALAVLILGLTRLVSAYYPGNVGSGALARLLSSSHGPRQRNPVSQPCLGFLSPVASVGPQCCHLCWRNDGTRRGGDGRNIGGCAWEPGEGGWRPTRQTPKETARDKTLLRRSDGTLVLKQSEFAIETDSTTLSISEPTTCYAPLLSFPWRDCHLQPNESCSRRDTT